MKIRESYGSRRYEEEYRAALEKSVHYFRQNSCITELRKMGYDQAKLQVEYEAEEYGKSEICCLDAETNTFFNSESAEKFIAENDLSKCENVNIYGDIRQIYCFGYDDKKVVYALTESDGMQNYITIPYISGENGEFCTDISSHRIWKREFSEKTSNLDCALRFRIAPDTWPNIKIKEADMSPDDIFAHAYEAIFNMEINSEKQVEIQLPYQKLCWNSEKKVLTCGKYQMEIKCDKKLSFVTIFDQYLTEIIADNKVLVLLNNLTNKAKEISVIDISGNLGKIRVGEDNDPHIQVETDKDTETEIVVYGLRGLAYSKDATEALRRKKKEDRLIFANDKFKVFDNHVEDSCYGRPDAYIISPEEIVSADRILEEFQWRKTKWGDMTRKSWRTDKWTADRNLKKYPILKSSSDILSATWNLAMTVFDRCTNGGYALPGQEHLWQAGLFQCKGEGFGVWLRDSVHIAMRGGNLIDPAQNQIQDLGLQPVKGRHVAAHHGDAALVVLFVADQLLIGNLPAVDGLVHRLIDDAVHGVGYPGGGKAPQQGPHLGPAVQGKCQQPGYGQQQQRPPDLGAIRPPVIVEKSGTHSPTSSAFGSYQLMRKGLFIISVR